MWPFKKKEKAKKKHFAKKMVAGVIIGGAIGSIVGKKLLEKHGADQDEGDIDDSGFKQTDV